MEKALLGSWTPLNELNTPQWQQNLAFIQARLPELLALLQTPDARENLEAAAHNGFLVCRRAGTNEWLLGGADPAQEVERIKHDLAHIPPSAGLCILFGGALGYAIAHALPWLRADETRRLLVLEPSVNRLKACLCFMDLRQALDSGRLHFELSDFSKASVLNAVKKYTLWTPQPVHAYPAPGVRLPFPPEQLQAWIQQHSRTYETQKHAVVSRVKESTGHKPAIGRVLLINCWPGAPSELHLRAIQQTLQARSVECRMLQFDRYRFDAHPFEYRRLIEPQLFSALDSFQPDMFISYGYHAPHFLERKVFASLNLPFVQAVSNIGYFDTCYYANEFTALIEKRLTPYFQRRGAPSPFFAPLMADSVSAAPTPTQRRFPIVFVGNSLARPPEEVQALYQRFASRGKLTEYLRQAERALSSFDAAVNLYDYLEANPLPEVENEEEAYAVFRHLLCQGSAARRVQLLERIADKGLVVFGGDWKAALGKTSPLNPCIKGYLPIHEEAKIFSLGHIFVNIHSVGHVTGPNMRFFNVPGMGGFEITDGQFGEYLQPDREAVYYHSIEEFEEKIDDYLCHIDEADAIRFAAHRRVGRDWTYAHWVEQVFNHLNLTLPN